MNIILKSDDLSKSYSTDKNVQRPILTNIDLSIEKGEFVSLMGPSGSGKSTLLYNLSGMDRCTSGRVTFDNEEISLFSEAQLSQLRLSKMGFIFQQIHLLKNLSLFDNIIFPAYLSKKNTQENINCRATALMQKMGIAELANNAITQASGGQLQRAAICRALINDPTIVFGDEPTGALDSKSAQDIMDILIGLNHAGTTLLLATHDIHVAAKTEQVIYIRDGKIVGEKKLGKFKHGNESVERERQLSEWLMTLTANS